MLSTQNNKPDHKNSLKDAFQDVVDRTWSPDEQKQLRQTAKKLSGKDILENESRANQPSQSSGESAEMSAGDGWFKDRDKGKKKGKAEFNKRRAIGSGIAGLVVGLTLAGLNIIQGPAQIIQVSSVFADIFFSRNSDTNDLSVRRLYNMATSNREKNNLGVMASILANRNRNAAAQAGIHMIFDTADNKGRAKLQSYELDPNTDKGRMMIERARSLGANLTEAPNGRLVVNTRGFEGGQVGRQLIAYQVELDNKKGVTGLIVKRRLKRLAGVSFRPLHIAKRAVETNSDYRKRRQAERAREASTGTTNRGTGRIDGGVDDNNNPRPVDADVDSDGRRATDLLEDIKSTDDPFDKRSKIIGAGSVLRTGATGGAIVAIACAVRDVGDNIEQYKMLNVVMPLIRLVIQYVAAGSQVQAMEDVDMDEVGSVVEPLYDEETQTSIFASRPIKAALGEEGGVDIDPAVKSQIVGAYSGDKPGVFTAIDNTSLLGSACRVNSWIGNLPVIKEVGDVTSAILSGLSSAATGKSIEEWLSTLVAILSGGAINTLARGAELGNLMAFGGILSSNSTAISQGGGALSQSAAYEWREYLHQQKVAKLKDRGFMERMFDLNTHDSLASSMLMRTAPYNGMNGLSYMSHRGVSKAIATPFSSIAKLLTPKALAQTIHSYDYGLPEFGIPLNLLNSERYEDMYENFDRLEDNDFAKLKEANQKWGKCFGNPLDDTGRLTDRQTESYSPVLSSDCTSSYQNQDFQDYQMYILDNATIKSLACYEGISQESCNEIGIGNVSDPVTTGNNNTRITGDPYTDSTGVPCAPGTEELPGVHDAYSGGQLFKVRLCSLPNLPSASVADNPGNAFSTPGANGFAVVNSRVSGAWFALANDALAAGINLSAVSSFRSMAHQEYLWSLDPNPELVAPPGGSSHQAGVAIDFAGMYLEGGQDCGAGRAREPGNPHWVWLHDNAENYGFKQYSAESWHWDALPAANRCGASL